MKLFLPSSVFALLSVANCALACPYLSKNGGFRGEVAARRLQGNDETTSSSGSGSRSGSGSGSGSWSGSGSGSEDELEVVPFDFVCDFEGTNAEEAVVSAQIAVGRIIQSDYGLGPKFLRLTFHDCVGGGCNGSVDMNDPDNKGLQLPIDKLSPLVDCYSEYLTRADIWVLAGLRTSKVLQFIDSDDDVLVSNPFEYYGRSSMDDETVGNGEKMPSAHFTTSQIVQFFNETFGFTIQETVAIMGAHALGRISPDNSGFRNGTWVANEHELDNDFYETLLDRNGFPDDRFAQTNENATNGQYLWRRGDNDDFLFLNADMALVSNMEGYLDQETGLASCIPKKDVANPTRNADMPECPPATLTLQYVRMYEDEGDIFLEDFSNAMVKMCNQQVATNNLKKVDGDLIQIAVQKLTNVNAASSGVNIIPSILLLSSLSLGVLAMMTLNP